MHHPLHRSSIKPLYKLLAIVCLILLLAPTSVNGQEPEDRPLFPSFVYLPVILHRTMPCATSSQSPTLRSPTDDALLTTEQPVVFTWQFSTNCPASQIHYSLQIATEAGFSPETMRHSVGYQPGDPPDEISFYTETSYDLSQTEAGVYYWRVGAFWETTLLGWSDPHRLTIEEPLIDQLLVNPSFEDDPTQSVGWQWLTPDTTSYTLRLDATLAHHGQQFLTINRQDSTPGQKSLYQDIDSPQAGTTYHFSVWIQASAEALDAGQPRTGRVDLWAYGGSPTREHSTHNFQISAPGWHCVETSLQVIETGHALLRAEVYFTALDGLVYYVDQATLRDDSQATCPPSLDNDDGTLVSHAQGFDTCAAPSVAQLAAWKQASPYDYFGIYLGGANHYGPCKSYNQQYQTAAWFTEVSQQGWQFVPIWVGPQAPCTGYSVRISSDLETARLSGINEARQAIAAAANLRLITAAKPGTIIYYDIEHYPIGDATCRAAVNAFLVGWVTELQNNGYKAGIYGSVWAVNDWYLLDHVPDSVWVASYIRSEYDAAMSVDPVNQSWITPSYWQNHHLFQYSNSHDETHGGLTLNIDNDVAAGLVAVSGTAATTANVQGMQFITPKQGWLWRGQQLFWTNNSGRQWRDITPPVTTFEAVFFADAAHGWLVSMEEADHSLHLWRTTNGGELWQPLPFDVVSGTPLGAVHLDFIDAQTGWLVLEPASGPVAAVGLLFKTTNGGITWTQLTLPGSGPVHFVTESFGWTVSGPTRSDLSVTRDGGQTWQRQTLSPTTAPVAYTLPHFVDKQHGLIAVTRYEAGQTPVEFYATQDGGQSWQRLGETSTVQPVALGVFPPTYLLNEQLWGLAEGPTFPSPIVQLQWVTSSTAWAHRRDNTCTQTCRGQDQLFQTTDSGQTWQEIELP